MASPLGLTDFSGIAYTSQDGSDASNTSFTGGYNSILNGSKFYYRPTISTSETDPPQMEFNSKSSKRHQPDNSTDDLYDISTNSIISYTANEQLKALTLKPADFAYLRDLGVYPNNRLVVCRRFANPVENDLTAHSKSPISTVVSYISDSADDFFSFQANEDWEPHSTPDPLNDLTNVFNEIFSKASGIDVKEGGKGVVGGMAKKFPVGGVAEALETEITNALLGDAGKEGSNIITGTKTGEGKPGTNFSFKNLHVGNPNFMAESRFRNINSIKSSISIPVKTVYELKYFPNVDPTIVYMDIIQNILRFSSSQSVFYLAKTGGSTINKFFNKLSKGEWVGALSLILEKIIEAISKVASKIWDTVQELADTATAALKKGGIEGLGIAAGDVLRDALTTVGQSAMARYRIEFSKIIPSASGASSAPWHITIGNPKNPFFSSGDMYVQGGDIKFGNTLGFNDLPTRIEFNFNIISARSLGIQEIFDKFNIGAGRQYQKNAIVFDLDFYGGEVKLSPNDDVPVSGAKNKEVAPLPPGFIETAKAPGKSLQALVDENNQEKSLAKNPYVAMPPDPVNPFNTPKTWQNPTPPHEDAGNFNF